MAGGSLPWLVGQRHYVALNRRPLRREWLVTDD